MVREDVRRNVGDTGGPIEIVWENEPGSPSTKPCANPSREYLPQPNGRIDPLIWLPLDCGACESCQAREAWRFVESVPEEAPA